MKKNKAVHKGNGLLPYPVIVSASQGDIYKMSRPNVQKILYKNVQLVCLS